jgi:hypothetical protein
MIALRVCAVFSGLGPRVRSFPARAGAGGVVEFIVFALLFALMS